MGIYILRGFPRSLPEGITVASQEQVQKQKQSTKTEEVEAQEVKNVVNDELTESTEDTLANIDDVLDAQVDEELLADIDDLLEENAQEFVAGYIQQGGQ